MSVGEIRVDLAGAVIYGHQTSCDIRIKRPLKALK